MTSSGVLGVSGGFPAILLFTRYRPVSCLLDTETHDRKPSYIFIDDIPKSTWPILAGRELENCGQSVDCAVGISQATIRIPSHSKDTIKPRDSRSRQYMAPAPPKRSGVMHGE